MDKDGERVEMVVDYYYYISTLSSSILILVLSFALFVMSHIIS